MRTDSFDLLIVGGGVTGAAVARDAVRRGLKVALIDKQDFAAGTSSRSSKLIHGGLRYLENFEIGLVFEALAERSLLLKTAPHLVRPLPFYWPIYDTAARGRALMSAGLWLYDMLSLFRTPGFHRYVTRKCFHELIPELKQRGLKGGFRYYDASMWDDAIVLELLRSAHASGLTCANYVEAVEPIWDVSHRRVEGFKASDRLQPEGSPAREPFELRANQVVVCAGPWTDQIGSMLSPRWTKKLNPSRGVHLVFAHDRLPVPGAVVMAHPKDGRISFVMPRPDYGAGVTIVGTTDGPAGENPDRLAVPPEDVDYLFEMLNLYFPELRLGREDLIATTIGVRPLVRAGEASQLQKVSREHHIDVAPGGVVWVAGGKYTTHRKMAEDIVDFTLKHAADPDLRRRKLQKPRTKEAMNPAALPNAVAAGRKQTEETGWDVPERLWRRYGAEAFEIMAIDQALDPAKRCEDLPGFPCLEAQFRFAMRTSMVMQPEDFFFRRQPLALARRDHGRSVAEALTRAWMEEMGATESQRQARFAQLQLHLESLRETR